MRLSLPMLFLLSKAQEAPEPQKPPVCGEYEGFGECFNPCFESNCNDYTYMTKSYDELYYMKNKTCPDCKFLTSFLKLRVFFKIASQCVLA